MAPDPVAIVIRLSRPDDEPALVRLAALDSRPVPAAPILLAEADGEVRAALSLSEGTEIADPFHRTAALAALLRTRADQLRGELRPTSAWYRVRLPRPLRNPNPSWSSSSITSAASRMPPT